MSVTPEARAPGEDVVGLARDLDNRACGIEDCGDPDCAAFRRAAATLRDLSRKLEEAREERGAYLRAANAAEARVEAAEARVEVLAAFARTAPGRLPSAVQAALEGVPWQNPDCALSPQPQGPATEGDVLVCRRCEPHNIGLCLDCFQEAMRTGNYPPPAPTPEREAETAEKVISEAIETGADFYASWGAFWNASETDSAVESLTARLLAARQPEASPDLCSMHSLPRPCRKCRRLNMPIGT